MFQHLQNLLEDFGVVQMEIRRAAEGLGELWEGDLQSQEAALRGLW